MAFWGSSNPKISKKVGYIGLDASNPPKKLSPNGCLLGLDWGGPHLFPPLSLPSDPYVAPPSAPHPRSPDPRRQSTTPDLRRQPATPPSSTPPIRVASRPLRAPAAPPSSAPHSSIRRRLFLLLDRPAPANPRGPLRRLGGGDRGAGRGLAPPMIPKFAL